jgi:short-subunit dehydrogenase
MQVLASNLCLLGKQCRGTIISFSSSLGIITIPGPSGYSITKLSGLQLALHGKAKKKSIIAAAFLGIGGTGLSTDLSLME